MYKRDMYTVLENKKIAKDVFLMVLEGDTKYITWTVYQHPGRRLLPPSSYFYLRLGR